MSEYNDMITQALKTRRLASEWHGGQGSALYHLASTGAIREDTRVELETLIRDNYPSEDDMGELDYLLAYVLDNGPRGPVAGWSDLRW